MFTNMVLKFPILRLFQLADNLLFHFVGHVRVIGIDNTSCVSAVVVVAAAEYCRLSVQQCE